MDYVVVFILFHYTGWTSQKPSSCRIHIRSARRYRTITHWPTLNPICVRENRCTKNCCTVKIWRVGTWWLAIFIIPASTASTCIIRLAFGHPVNIHAIINTLMPGILLGITAGLMEEFGWRGFLLPHLLKRYTPLTASLILGLIWGGLWHGYADYFGLGDRGVYFWPVMLLLGPILLTAWSYLLTWVYIHTKGSLLLSIVMHAGISSSALIFGQTYTSHSEELIWTAVSVGIAICISIGIFLKDKMQQV